MIGPSSHVSKLLLTLFFLLLIFYVYMDINMYIRIQNYPIGKRDSLLFLELHENVNTLEPKNFTSYNINNNLLNGTVKKDTSENYKYMYSHSSTVHTNGQSFVNMTRVQRSTKESPIEYETVTWVSCDINPLCYPTVKGLMLDHTNHYLFAPLVSIIDNIIGISEKMLFITPNMISYSHVFLAMIAGRLVSMDNLAYRRVGVVIFQIRTFLDDMDGHVARARKHIHGERSEVGTSGYFIDGFCDLLGCICLIVGVFWYLKNNPPRRGYSKVHTVLPHYNEVQNVKEQETNGEVGFVYKPKISLDMMIRIILMFSGQLLLSSIAWNRYIDVYQDALERDDASVNASQMKRQLYVFRSGLFFAVAWLWKIVNVHNLMHFILFSIFCDKLWEFLKFIQYSGYALLIAAVCFTEMHVMKVQNYIFKSYAGTQL